MVDGVLLLVDALEGCMPQTRYVLKKSIEQNKKTIVVLNKIDRDGARPLEVIDEVLDLFIELGATDEQFNFPILFASGKQGYAKYKLEDSPTNGLTPLLDTIIKHINGPEGKKNAPLQLLIANVDYNDYLGRIGIGRIQNGVIKVGQNVIVCSKGKETNAKLSKLFTFEGLKRKEVIEVEFGDIVAIAGIDNISIGDTICYEVANPIPFAQIDAPTLSMQFMVNDSPFAGKEGKFVTSRHIRDRLFKEVQTNVSMIVEETASPDTFIVYGRGELHLSILIETMRREGYEFAVSRPQVLYKIEDNKKFEPIEILIIDVPNNYVGSVMSKVGQRKADLISMTPDERGGTRLEFSIPTRCLMGYRNEMLTDTKGHGIMTHRLIGYEQYKGEYDIRQNGALIAYEQGLSTAYALHSVQERGTLFIDVNTMVYEGMIVGMNNKNDDIVVNVCKRKQLTNVRASGSDESLKIDPPTFLSLEQSIEFLADDELLEVTPTSIRLRKRLLKDGERRKTR
jgi:GTP-binding protein